MLLAALVIAAAAPSDTLLHTEVRLAALGVRSVESIRRGRVALVRHPDGVRLSVPMLSERAVPAPAPDESASPLWRWLDGPEPGGAGSAAAGPAVVGAAASGDATRSPDRALWVWNTAELLVDADARARFLDFLEARAVTRVFLQLPPAPGARPESGFVPFDGAALAPLLSAIHARGAEVDALDGDAHYALPENHAGVVRTVERVVAHNARAAPEARFDGVRYDIEPYLVAGFGGARRRAILDGYVTVVSALAETARRGGLRVGVDIPFWFDGADEETARWFTATVARREAPVLVHLFEAVDEVAVMDYRTETEGPNGALALVATELALGAALGTRVLVGLESEPLPDEELRGFAGGAVRGLPPEGGSWVVVVPRPEGRAGVWFVPEGADRGPLIRMLGAGGVDRSAVRAWRSRSGRTVPGSLLSFHGSGVEAMEEVAARIVERLAGHPAFGGVALHHYGSLSEPVRGDPGTPR